MSLERVRRLELTVAPSDAGVRVELLLRRRFGLSGTVIRRIKWLEDGILRGAGEYPVRPQSGTGPVRPAVRPGAAQRRGPRPGRAGHPL